MDSLTDIDGVLVSQRIFRTVMETFAHPFRIYNIKDGMPENETTIKELCFVFLDNAVSFHVHGDHGDLRLTEEIREMTYARPASLEKADFVIVKDIRAFDSYENLCQGSLVDPHKGATVIFDVPGIGGEEKIVAEGPGINGKIIRFVDKNIADCLCRTAKLDMEYPKGFEIIFACPKGDILAVPRHTRIFREVV
ncbi:MAG: phosphonate C-P lyase system protein PhnH [Oscillospiraceae bacterium]|jgi:alpha-D-ribose 1-methylphosphonate 5-triphosphate synthase subunit PhnH|nr:phosphonate C-P lyase system protein PhnH [Oscillospiraceae bacterium]